MERTLVLLKPDTVQRGLIGEILLRLEKRGIKMIGMKMISVTKELAEKHYAEHIGKSFYEPLIAYICSSPVVAMVCEAPAAVQTLRQMCGKTNPLDAEPGSIRHDFALTTGRNLIHASDSVENADKEIKLWFSPEEIFCWEKISDPWVFKTN